MRGVQKTRARIAGKANRRPELKAMIFLGPGKVIQKVVHSHLEIVAIGEALIQPQKRVPRLVGIPHHSKTLPRVSQWKEFARVELRMAV